MRYTLLVLLLSLLFRSDAIGQTRQDVERQTCDYYSQWIGVQAPEFPYPLRDRRDDGPELQLQDYRGKRLLLVGLDTGDFVDGPRDENGLMHQLAVLHNLRRQYGTNVAIIAFTYGPAFFMPGYNPPVEIKKLTDFPIINNNKFRNAPLPEPFNLMLRWPSLIAIDKQGIIVGIYSPPLVASNIVDAFAIDNWTGNVRLPPRYAPSDVVSDWSCRNSWFVFKYVNDLSSGSTFQMGYGRRERVYLASEVPADTVLGLKALEGRKLKRDVKAGIVIKESDFEESNGRTRREEAPTRQP